jgi:hypothetical protein
MNTDKIKEYSFLWDGSSVGWVLLASQDHPDEYSVFNKVNRTLLHIESTEIKDAVCDMMKKHGCETLENVPPGSVEVTESSD